MDEEAEEPPTALAGRLRSCTGSSSASSVSMAQSPEAAAAAEVALRRSSRASSNLKSSGNW